jgi:predicted AAA+ superfamily ATPase
VSFDVGESGYKALKSVLEGSLELPPENVRVYATSNRRHLMPEFMSDNLKSEVRDGELHPAEAIEEQVSLADRFGLQLSFYPFSQAVYLQAVDLLFPQVQDREALHLEAVRFATGKGVRNGRTAQQFYRQFAGDPRFC